MLPSGPWRFGFMGFNVADLLGSFSSGTGTCYVLLGNCTPLPPPGSAGLSFPSPGTSLWTATGRTVFRLLRITLISQECFVAECTKVCIDVLTLRCHFKLSTGLMGTMWPVNGILIRSTFKWCTTGLSAQSSGPASTSVASTPGTWAGLSGSRPPAAQWLVQGEPRRDGRRG